MSGKPTYLVTGAAGFIGSALVRALLARGAAVRGYDNLSTGNLENIEEVQRGFDFRQADLLDEKALADACAGVDHIFHQAAIPSVPRSVADPLASNRANVEGTLNLLKAARAAGVKRVVYAGSSSVYGDTPTLPKLETMAPNPISPYAVSKLAGEYYAACFYRSYGIETVTLRYFNVFGPRQAADSPYSGVLAKFISAMLEGDTPVIFGDGEQSRDFTYIDNVVEANLAACHAPAEKVTGRSFNIAGGRRVTLNQTVELLRDLTGYRGQVRYDAPRAGDVKHSLADIAAAQDAFGYRPTVAFTDGLAKTVEWYRSARAAAVSKRAGE